MLADQVVAAAARTGATSFPMIGVSLGGAVAVTAAVRHPEQVSALVLTVGLTHADAQSLSFIGAWRALDAAGDRRALAQLLVPACSTAEGLTALTSSDYENTIEQAAASNPVGGADHAELAARVDVRPLLPQVRVPTLVIVGGQDRVVLPSTVRELSAISGAEMIEYPAAGHIFSGPTAARWVDDVLAFLDRHV